MDKYRWWDIYEYLPEGWVIDKINGSPAPNTVFITNGKSPMNGQKRELLKTPPKNHKKAKKVFHVVKTKIKQESTHEHEEVPFPAQIVNTLARAKFKEQLLKEIRFDLMVCEVEGWNKKEYIEDLQHLLNNLMEQELYQILKNHKLTPKKREEVLADLGVSESTSIRECRRCEYDNKLGFCPRCDTQAYSSH